jgi:hypothetical protein
MAAKMLVRYRTKMLKRPEEIQDVSFLDLKRAIPVILSSFLAATPYYFERPSRVSAHRPLWVYSF